MALIGADLRHYKRCTPAAAIWLAASLRANRVAIDPPRDTGVSSSHRQRFER